MPYKDKEMQKAHDRNAKVLEREKLGPEEVRRRWNEWYQNNKEKRRAYQQTKAIANPEKIKARNLVTYALQTGRLTRSTICEECGAETRTDAHHHDYPEPLDVIWICRPCHRAKA